jgi:hypothetical protein
MTPEQRKKLEQIMVDRYMERVTFGDKRKPSAFVVKAYKMYSNEALLNLVLNPDSP